METVIPFTYFNTQTSNHIAGITYTSPKSSSTTKSNSKQNNTSSSSNSNSISKYNNSTPFHFVFAHATGFCKEVFVDLVTELRERGITSPITSIDHANHGESTKHLKCDWQHVSLDLYAVIENVIRPNDPNKILIGIGHSMGATVSALVEIAHPKTYECLVLMEPIIPPPPYERTDTNLSEMTLKRRSVFPDKESVKSSFSSKPPFSLWTKGSLDSYVEHGFKQSVIDGEKVVELKAKKEEEAEFYRMGSAHGGSELFPEIRIPFLILKGADSTFSREYYSTIITKCKQHAEYGEVIGGSHFFPMEKPDIVADKVLDFMKRNVNTRLESKL